MSSGDDIRMRVILESGEAEGKGAPGKPSEGNVPDQDNRAIVNAELVNNPREQAAEAALGRALRWLPMMRAPMARKIAQGMVSGYKIGDFGRATEYGYQQGGASGAAGAWAGAAAKKVARSAAVAAVMGNPITAASMVAVGAGIALLTAAVKLNTRALGKMERLLAGSGILRSLEEMQKARLLVNKERLAYGAYPEMSRSMAMRTQREIALMNLASAMESASLKLTNPSAEIGTSLLQIADQLGTPVIEFIGDAAGWMNEMRTWVTRWNLREIKDWLGVEDQDIVKEWKEALDINALHNQPFPDVRDASGATGQSIFNPGDYQ